MSTDITIIELEKQSSQGLQESKLILQFSGKLASTTLTNSLRRCALNNIPTYAFDPNTIYIDGNSSIFDNDEMRCRISQIIIPEITVPVIHLENKYWKDIDFGDTNRPKHPKDKMLIEFYINARNDTTSVMNVTTNDADIYIDSDSVKKIDAAFPHLVIQLKPKQIFKCRAVAQLGIGLKNNIWSGAANSYYDELSENKIKFTILSQGQMHEYDILYRSCIVIQKELLFLKHIFKNSIDKHKTKDIKLKIDNYDYTVCGILNEFLQSHNDVIFSAISKPDHLISQIVITLKTNKNHPIDILFEVVDHLVKVYENIKNQLMKLGKKHITLSSE